MGNGIDLQALVATAVALIPVGVVVGTAMVLTVGGIIGCSKCLLGWLQREAPERKPAPAVRTRLA